MIHTGLLSSDFRDIKKLEAFILLLNKYYTFAIDMNNQSHRSE
jgi:hypothetical protein